MIHAFVCNVFQLLTHVSVPDENFECMKVKAKVGYVGMLQDGMFSLAVVWPLAV